MLSLFLHLLIQREWTLLKDFLVYSQDKSEKKLLESKQFKQFVLNLFVWTKIRWFVLGIFFGVLGFITILYFINK